jgi:hypothetical protein
MGDKACDIQCEMSAQAYLAFAGISADAGGICTNVYGATGITCADVISGRDYSREMMILGKPDRSLLTLWYEVSYRPPRNRNHS